jgi:alpha-beta hydrolase superfamily lysophospholipase
MICVGFARRFIQSTSDAASRRAELRCPFFIVHGGADTISLPAGSALLHEGASTPKDMRQRKEYPGGLHEMLNSDQRETVMQDVMGWVRSRL